MLKKLRVFMLVGLTLGLSVFTWANGSQQTSSQPKEATSGGVVEVNLWDFLSGGDGVRWKQIISDFNASQTGVKVTSTTLTWGDTFYTKVHTAVISGQTPDVMTYHLSHFPAGLKANDLRPITEEELQSVGLSFKDFNPILVNKSQDISASYGTAGSMYGIPLDTHTHIIYFNKDILKKAGLLGADGRPTGLTGIDNFTAALKKIKETTGEIPLAFSSSQDSGTVWRLFYTLFAQQGGSFTPNGKFSMDQLDTYGVKALQTMTDWTAKGYIPTNAAYAAAIALFSSGKAAMMVNGNWEVPTMVDLQKSGKLPFEYGVMAFPQLFDNQSTWADSHQIVIPRNTKNPLSPEKLKAVLTFVAYVEKHADLWAGGGHIPAYMPVLNGPEMAKMEPNNQYSVQAAKDIYLEPVSPVFGVGTPALNYVDNFFTPALAGKITVKDAIAKFKAGINDALK
jgi:multiple sugar transport system substrate-binding protein